MKYNESAVFKWVLIVGAAAGSVIALTLLTRPLVGDIWGLILVIAGSAYGIRWTREWWRNSRDLPGGPDHRG
jgi:uncharacterized membrane protein